MSPAVFTAQGVPIGDRIYLDVPLVLSLGEGESPQNFAVDVLPPEMTGRRPIDGFEDIPPGAFEVDGEPILFVGIDEPAIRKLFANFPNDSAMFNRRFMVQLRIMPEGPTGNMVAAILANYLIETESNPSVRTGGWPIAVAPSVVDFDESGIAELSIFNNDTIVHDIHCAFGVPEADPRGVAIALSPGFSPANGDIFSLDETSFTIDAGGSRNISITISQETLAEITSNVEAILWLRIPEVEGGARFVRLRLKPY
ncbi:MAG TPA: hypothetical protein ENN07_00110 [candidate division Zixibacteria bacterium]|nr:hypothetical protein [candidate division Zixibacteria bacterium]